VDLAALKESLDPAIPWYPYTTLSQLVAAGAVLSTAGEPFEKMAGTKPVLDIGCGDGDLAFLLAHCGYAVTAIDHPRSNQSGMAGVKRMQAHFGGPVEVVEKDLDRPFEGPQPEGGFAFLLGVLYHLENPVQVLRWLAQRAEYVLLSTRVARFSPAGQALEPAPVAYLTDEAELNNDNSNFWIFTPAGLRRLLRRAGWSLLAMDLRGAEDSRPSEGEEHDERAYCLAKTTRALRNIETAYGWTEDEGEPWRWTYPRFAAWIRPPAGVREARLAARIFIPEEQHNQTGAVVMTASAAGRALGPRRFAAAGEWVYQAEVAGLAGDGAPVFVEFEVEKPFRAPPPDDRDLGIVVCGLELS
jgi:SAM-dependent methyltransferase